MCSRNLTIVETESETGIFRFHWRDAENLSDKNQLGFVYEDVLTSRYIQTVEISSVSLAGVPHRRFLFQRTLE